MTLHVVEIDDNLAALIVIDCVLLNYHVFHGRLVNHRMGCGELHLAGVL